MALDPGEPGAHLLDLEGVVVEEDEAVEAEVQGRGEVADVLALLRPVAAVGHEIVQAERHRALGEDRAEILLVVLRHRAEQDPEALQAQELALELGVDDPRIVAVDLQVLHAVLADDAAPERIVGVNHHHLAPRLQPRRNGVGVALVKRVHGGRGVGHLVHVPVALTEGVGEAEQRQGTGGVDDADPLLRPGEVEQHRVHPRERLQLVVEVALDGRDRHERHGVEDDRPRRAGETRRDQVGEAARAGDGRLVRSDVEEPAVVEMHDQDVGGGGSRQHLLDLSDGEMLARDRGEIREAARHLPERVGDDVSDETDRQGASRGHPRYRSLRHPADACPPAIDRPLSVRTSADLLRDRVP